MTPSAWLKDTLEKRSTWPNSGIDELLPLNPAFLEAVKHNKHWPSMRLSWMLTKDAPPLGIFAFPKNQLARLKTVRGEFVQS
jgi:hypothetical protein